MSEIISVKPAYDCIDAVRELLIEYCEMLGVDLEFQGFDKEISGLPGKYSHPYGRLYIAEYRGKTAGCIGLRRLGGGNKLYTCEMKRLYVRPDMRGKGIGGILARRLIAEASIMGYKEMLLDTLISLDSALKLYKKLGFEEIPPYYVNPLEDVVYMCKKLDNM